MALINNDHAQDLDLIVTFIAENRFFFSVIRLVRFEE